MTKHLMNPVDELARLASSQADKLRNCAACNAVKPVSCGCRNRSSFGIRSFQHVLDSSKRK